MTVKDSIKKVRLTFLESGDTDPGAVEGETLVYTLPTVDLGGGASAIGRVYADATVLPDPTPELWAPSLAGGTKGWIDASFTANIADTSNTVTQVNNRVEDANHFVAGGAPLTNTRTVNGLNVIDFDGVDDVLHKSSHVMPAASLQFVQVMVFDALPSQPFIRAGGTSRFTANALGTGPTRPNVDMFGAGNTGTGFAGVITQDVVVIMRWLFDAVSGGWKMFVNGEEVFGVTDGYTTPFNDEVVTYMGNAPVGGNYANGALCEAFIIIGADDELGKKHEGYSRAKWAGTLVAGHPYETDPPVVGA
ncbi:MAG: hypothetical protein DHS20C05_19030 [Hyphococcus sp.]|nr:MAG: hypothetical protein DHS20C05_19030 [Marinicaulis sp.]